MSIPSLDRSRPFGTIHPAGDFHGAHFTQGGFYFDHEGKIVESLITQEQREQLSRPADSSAKPAKKPPAAAPVLTKEQYDVLKAANLVTPEQEAAYQAAAKQGESESEPSESEIAGDGELNLEQWLRGAATADFKAVRLAVKARYHVWKTSKTEMVEFLVTDPDPAPRLVPIGELDPELRKLLP